MEEFINQITEQMRCVRAREYVARELRDHITDQAAAYEEKGVSCEEAIKEALREMGDPVEVGMELDRIHRPQTDYVMVGMAFLFSLGGMVVLYMAGGLAEAPIEFSRQCIYLLLSFGVMAGIYFLDYTIIGRYPYVAAVLTMALFIIGVAIPTMTGHIGKVPETQILAYLYVPVFAGILYRLRGKGYRAVTVAMAVEVAMAIVICGLATLHTAFAVYGMCLVLLLLAIRKGWFVVRKNVASALAVAVLVVLPLGLAAAGLFFSWNEDSFRVMRVRAYLNPEQYAGGAGYVYQYIRELLGAAKFIGASDLSTYMESGSMSGFYIYRSEPFILLQLVSRYGILAGVLVVFAFAAVTVHAFHIVRRQKNQLGSMVSIACFMVFLVNCTEGVLMNTGYYPVTSMQFPFVSYGVGASVTYAVLIGLLLSIYRNEKIVAECMAEHRAAWRLSIKIEKR